METYSVRQCNAKNDYESADIHSVITNRLWCLKSSERTESCKWLCESIQKRIKTMANPIEERFFFFFFIYFARNGKFCPKNIQALVVVDAESNVCAIRRYEQRWDTMGVFSVVVWGPLAYRKRKRERWQKENCWDNNLFAVVCTSWFIVRIACGATATLSLCFAFSLSYSTNSFCVRTSACVPFTIKFAMCV